VFTYSSRPGTAAARMKGHLPGEVKKGRSAQLREVFDELGRAYRQRFVGRTLRVLWESVTEVGQWGWGMQGHAGNFVRVTAQAPSPRWNMVDEVWLTGLAADGMAGEILGGVMVIASRSA
jgi:threonylcarbamoyladenosine tRNA methylthiotransferase MtaB